MKRFTLIELLVVVAIIGILASMLLPSLSKAREAGKRAVCLSNLKQVGVALQMYIDDNNSYFPSKGSGSHQFYWFGKRGTLWTTKPSKRHLNIYVLSQNPIPDDIEVPLAECPSDDRHYDERGSSYNANNHGSVNNLYKSPVTDSWHINDVKSPSKFIVMQEYGGDKSMQGNNPPEHAYFHTPYGKRNWNVLFADSHVKFIRINDGQKSGSDFTFIRTD